MKTKHTIDIERIERDQAYYEVISAQLNRTLNPDTLSAEELEAYGRASDKWYVRDEEAYSRIRTQRHDPNATYLPLPRSPRQKFWDRLGERLGFG